MGTQKNRLNEHPKHMFKLMGKEINAISGAQIIFIGTYVRVFSFPPEETVDPWLPIEHQWKTLIRLGRCTEFLMCEHAHTLAHMKMATDSQNPDDHSSCLTQSKFGGYCIAFICYQNYDSTFS